MAWYDIFKRMFEKDYEDINPNYKNMNEEKSQNIPEIDWTGITANDGGGFSINYEIYSKRPDFQKSEKKLENLAISLGLKKPDINRLQF